MRNTRVLYYYSPYDDKMIDVSNNNRPRQSIMGIYNITIYLPKSLTASWNLEEPVNGLGMGSSLILFFSFFPFHFMSVAASSTRIRSIKERRRKSQKSTSSLEIVWAVFIIIIGCESE